MVEPRKSRAGKICVLRVVLWKELLVVKQKKGLKRGRSLKYYPTERQQQVSTFTHFLTIYKEENVLYFMDLLLAVLGIKPRV